MSAASDRPILVTGSHRSGTTWVGRMLSAAHGVAHLHEPLNPANRLSWLGVPPRHAFLYIDDADTHDYGPAFDRMMQFRPPVVAQLRTVRSPRNLAANVRESARAVRWRRRATRVLLKDPLALMSADWFARRYDASVVLMVRHPAAFAGSLKRLDWRFDFGEFLAQPDLMTAHLEPYADEIAAAAASPPEIIDQAILLWRCLNSVVAAEARRHPDWLLVRYEDVAADPARRTRELYDHLRLRWDASTANAVERLSSAENPVEADTTKTRDVQRDSGAAMWTWRARLEPDEVARVRMGTADVAAQFYGNDDWVPPAESSRSNKST